MSSFPAAWMSCTGSCPPMPIRSATQEEIDPKDFDTVIDSIIGAHRIYILGLRSSGVLAGSFPSTSITSLRMW